VAAGFPIAARRMCLDRKTAGCPGIEGHCLGLVWGKRDLDVVTMQRHNAGPVSAPAYLYGNALGRDNFAVLGQPAVLDPQIKKPDVVGLRMARADERCENDREKLTYRDRGVIFVLSACGSGP
jgi:hypothetical protein